jgi:photosystem II stability/assembly factor-like uncharacterized protein
MISLKNIFRISGVIVLILSIYLIHSCQKDDPSNTRWDVLSCGETISKLTSVFFIDENTGYAVGYNETATPYSSTGFILKTTDGGYTWSSTKTNGDSIYWLFNVFFHESNTGYVTGYIPQEGALLLKTINGGTTWNKIALDTAYFLRLSSAYFIDANSGYITGYKNSARSYEWYGTILKTTDGGNTWSALNITNPRDATLNSVCFPDAVTGYSAGAVYAGGAMYNGVFLKTVDGGATWINKSTTIKCAFKSIFFTDKNTGYGVGETIVGTGNSTIIKTTNGGDSWTTLTLPGGSDITLNSIYFSDTNTGYAVGSQHYKTLTGYKTCAVILKTTDGGLTWEETLVKNIAPLNSVYIAGPKTVYTVGENGIILKGK